MKLTPLDIKKQEFKKGLRGYDSLEVDAFLEMISEEYEALIRERNHLSDEVLKLKTQLKDYQQVERTFKESLMKAQQTIDQSRENAHHEAELKIKEAELKAEKILESTKIQLSEMKNELLLVKAQKDSFAKRLRHLLESQLELIGVLEIDDIGFGKIDEPIASSSEKKISNQTNSKKSEIEFSPIEDDDPDESVFDSKANNSQNYGFSKNKPDAQLSGPTLESGSKIDKDTEILTRNDRKKIKLSDQFII